MTGIAVKSADWSAVAVDYRPPTPFQDFGDGSLFAGYMLGSGYDGGNPLRDWTGNGRALTAVGAPVLSPLYATLDQTDYYAAPFAPKDVGAGGGMTVLAVARDTVKAAAVGPTFFLSSNTPVGVKSVGLYADHSSQGAVGVFTKTPTTVTAMGGLTGDTHYATAAPEFLAGAYTPAAITAYRGHASLPLGQTAAAAGSYAAFVDMVQKFAIGGANGVAESSAVIYGMAFYSRVLTLTEMTKAMARIKRYSELRGVVW